jgi:hypothetical protein
VIDTAVARPVWCEPVSPRIRLPTRPAQAFDSAPLFHLRFLLWSQVRILCGAPASLRRCGDFGSLREGQNCRVVSEACATPERLSWTRDGLSAREARKCGRFLRGRKCVLKVEHGQQNALAGSLVSEEAGSRDSSRRGGFWPEAEGLVMGRRTRKGTIIRLRS